MLAPFRCRGGHHLITARWPVLTRYCQRGGASTHHSEMASVGPLPPTRRSINSSLRDGQCWPPTANEAEHRLITVRWPVLAHYRQPGGASTHHSEMASVGPLPPTRRSIDSSQRDGQCWPDTANKAEHHLITAARPVSARFNRRHTKWRHWGSQRPRVQPQPAHTVHRGHRFD